MRGQGRGAPVNVLLVDDNEALRKLMTMTLSLDPAVGEIVEAGDGETALRLCEGFRPDVVVLDYWMPVMDGGTAATLIRALHPQVRIVAYSAVLTHRPDWADDYMPKDGPPDVDLVVGARRNGLDREEGA